MAKRTKAEIQADIEELLGEYLAADTELDSVMVTRYLIKATGAETGRFPEPGDLGVSTWIVPNHQDIYTSMGMLEALSVDVGEFYAAMYAGRLDPDE